jgi:hypothetical protein
MRNINKKGLLILATLLTAVLMIGVPLSAAASPSTPAYLASGSSMNYVMTDSGYTYTHSYNYNKTENTGYATVTNVTTPSATAYYNASVVSSNSTVATVTNATSISLPQSLLVFYNIEGLPLTKTTTYSNLSLADAKYIAPIYLKSTSKNVTITTRGAPSNPGNMTYNYTSTSHFAYYKSDFGSVKAVEYVLSGTMAGKNYTGTLYYNPTTNMILSYNVTTYYTSGTVAADKNYTINSSTTAMSLTSTSVVPITTDYTGAYVGIGVAIVLLGISVYYFYGRKHEAPKHPAKETEEKKDSDEKPKQ